MSLRRALFLTTPGAVAGCGPDGSDDPRAVALYDYADDVAYLDGPGGAVRVWYSERGPNAADTTDRDDNRVPDIVQQTAQQAEDALAFYAFLGFASPLSERDLGLEALGGSDALDLYLVDPSSVSVWGRIDFDACETGRCAVHVLLPGNDVSIDAQIAWWSFVATQAAYDVDEPDWLFVGTADHACYDLLGGYFVSCRNMDTYFARTGCGLDWIDGERWCAGAAEGTALIWEYFDAVGVPDAMLRTIEATVAWDGAAALDAGLRAEGVDLESAWPAFAAANLATGPRAGGAGTVYPNADSEDGITAEAEGATVADQSDWYPLSARYYRVDHAGGHLWLACEDDPGPLVASVHPVAGGAADGPLASSAGPWGLPAHGALDLGEYDPGGVWVVVSHPRHDGPITRVRFAFCSGEDASACDDELSGCAGLAWGLGGVPALAAWRRGRARPATRHRARSS
jgi:hypothetical protein